MKTKLFTFIATLLFSIINAQDGTVYTGFNPGTGIPSGPVLGVVKEQSDGKILIGGNMWQYNATPVGQLLRLTLSGAIDEPFNTNAMDLFGDSHGVGDIEFQSDNKIIAVGNFRTYFNATTNGIMRLNSDGTLDSSFNVGTGTNNTISACAIQPDGKVIIVGIFSQYNGTPMNCIARLNTDGSLDATFNIGNGFSNIGDDSVSDVEIQNNKILVVGSFTLFNGTAVNNILRLNADGSIDNTFIQGTGLNGTGYDMILQNDGKILVQGNFTHYNGNAYKSLVRLNSDGAIDLNFMPVSFNAPFAPDLWGISLQPDQKILANGMFNSFNGEAKDNLVRLLPDGTLDCTFHNLTYFGPGTYPNSTVGLCKALSNKIAVLGGFGILDGHPRMQIALLNCDGTAVPAADTFSVTVGTAYTSSSVLANDLMYGSPATTANATLVQTSPAIPGITFNAATGVVTVAATVAQGVYTLTYNLCSPNTACPDCKEAQVTISVMPPITIVANPDNFTSTCINGLIGGVSPSITANDTMNGNPINSASVTVVLDSTGGLTGLTVNSAGVITIPLNTPVGTYIINYTVKEIANPNNYASSTVTLCINNGLNPGTGPNGFIYGIARENDGKIIIVGDFTRYNNIRRNKIARLNPDMSLDLTFDANGVGFLTTVYDIAIDSNGKVFVVGGFNQTSTGIPVRCIARLKKTTNPTTNGTVDTSFVNNTISGGSNPNAPILYTIVIDGNNDLYVGGWFDEIAGLYRTLYAKLSNSGVVYSNYSTVPPFASGGGVVNALALNGTKLLIGGAFQTTNGIVNHVIQALPNGNIDTAFVWGKVTGSAYDMVNSIKLAGSNIIVAGSFTKYNGISNKNIAMVYPNGSVVPIGIFSPGNANNLISDVEVTSSNIIIVGDFTSYGGVNRNRIARLKLDGNLDTTFNPGMGADDSIIDALVQPDGKIIIGGRFSEYNGIMSKRLTRILSTNAGMAGRPAIEDEVIEESALEKSDVAFYPNPTTGKINISLGNFADEIFAIKIYNTLGQEVFSANTLKNENNNVNISYLQSGTYFIILSNDKRTVKRTIIKE